MKVKTEEVKETRTVLELQGDDVTLLAALADCVLWEGNNPLAIFAEELYGELPLGNEKLFNDARKSVKLNDDPYNY